MNFAILSALIVMGGLGLLFGAGLALASRVFFVKRDPRVAQVEEVLPGVNCGACGAPGCAGFAEGIVEGKYPPDGCTVGGVNVSVRISKIMGTESGEFIPKFAVVRCRGNRENCPDRAVYHGVMDCKAAILVDNGAKGCVYGCLGLGTCVASCPFYAISMKDDGLPEVDEALCVGCGKCVQACPRGIFQRMPRNQHVFVACVSKDFGKRVKAVCKVGCIGCGLCANPKTTADEIVTMDGKLPVIHFEKIKDVCEDLKNAVEKCPTHSFGVRRKEPSVPAEVVHEEEAPS